MYEAKLRVSILLTVTLPVTMSCIKVQWRMNFLYFLYWDTQALYSPLCVTTKIILLYSNKASHLGVDSSRVIVPLRLLAAQFPRVFIRKGTVSRLRGNNANSSRYNYQVVCDEQQDRDWEGFASWHQTAEYFTCASEKSQEATWCVQTATSDHSSARTAWKTSQWVWS